jgi:hypothetical protein
MKQSKIRNIYLKKVDKKEKNKLDFLEQKTNYIEDIFKKVEEKQKEKQKEKQNRENIVSSLVGNVIKKSLGKITKVNEEKQNRENIVSSLVGNVIKKSLGKITKGNEEIKPVELFGGTRSGAIIHPEATAPPQPIFGKDIDKSIFDNFENIKKIYNTPPKSFQEVKDAKSKINEYKQRINRIKKRDAKTILSPEQIALKKDTLDEITKLQKTYDKIYKEFYKDQQPKKGRPKKGKV